MYQKQIWSVAELKSWPVANKYQGRRVDQFWLWRGLKKNESDEGGTDLIKTAWDDEGRRMWYEGGKEYRLNRWWRCTDVRWWRRWWILDNVDWNIDWSARAHGLWKMSGGVGDVRWGQVWIGVWLEWSRSLINVEVKSGINPWFDWQWFDHRSVMIWSLIGAVHTLLF